MSGNSNNNKKDSALRRKKAAWCATCVIILALSIGYAAWCLSNLAPFYGKYQYGARENRLALPEITKPSLMQIDIYYEGKKPESIMLWNADEKIYGMEPEYDDANKKITVRFDTNVLSKDYELSLLPADNLELTYDIDVMPSPSHVDAEVEWYSDKNSHLWVYFKAAYPLDDSTLHCFIRGEGQNYQPTIYETMVNQDDEYRLDLTKIIDAKKIDLERCRSVKLTFSGSAVVDPVLAYDMVNNKYLASDTFTLMTSVFPDHDEDADHTYSLVQTNAYIESLNLKPTIEQEEDQETQTQEDPENPEDHNETGGNET